MASGTAAERATRLLSILHLLKPDSRISLDAIAEILGVTSADVVEDLETLSCCGLAPYTPEALVPVNGAIGSVLPDCCTQGPAPPSKSGLAITLTVLVFALLSRSPRRPAAGGIGRSLCLLRPRVLNLQPTSKPLNADPARKNLTGIVGKGDYYIVKR